MRQRINSEKGTIIISQFLHLQSRMRKKINHQHITIKNRACLNLITLEKAALLHVSHAPSDGGQGACQAPSAANTEK